MVSRSFTPPSAEVQERNDLNFDSWKIGRDGSLCCASIPFSVKFAFTGPLKLAYPGKIDTLESKMIEVRSGSTVLA